MRSKTTVQTVGSISGVARGGGGASGGTRPGAQALGTHQHTFCKHLKTRFKQKFRPKYT